MHHVLMEEDFHAFQMKDMDFDAYEWYIANNAKYLFFNTCAEAERFLDGMYSHMVAINLLNNGINFKLN